MSDISLPTVVARLENGALRLAEELFDKNGQLNWGKLESINLALSVAARLRAIAEAPYDVSEDEDEA